MPKVPHTCINCGQFFYEWAYRRYKRCPECRKIKPPFTRGQLEKLYLERGLSALQIAKETGTTKPQVKYWLKKYEIPRRKPIETRFPDRPIPPSKEILYNLYWIQYLSYAEIARIYQVDATAVPYWLRKYDIPRRNLWETRRKGNSPKEPTTKELQDLYCNQGFSTQEIGAIYDLSAQTIARRLKKYSIPLRLPGYNQIRYIAEDGHELLSGLELRVDNWLSNHDLRHDYEPDLPFGGKADFLVKDIYIEVWGINHNDSYKQRIREKIKLYKEHDLTLIGLYPKDILKNLDKKLKSLISL